MTSKPVRVNLTGEVDLDPRDIYYTHSKIRPFFSGCGKRIVDTIAEIESGQTSAKDLPQMSVIQDAEGHSYCLNNRRLYVFKHLRRLGLLEGDTVTVRMKKGIPRELAKYTPQKCSLNCTILREKAALELDKEQDDENENGQEHDDTKEHGTAQEEGPHPVIVVDDSAAGVASVREKYDKKKFHAAPEETEEERYQRQKERIAAAREQCKLDAAVRQRKKQEIAALLRGSGEQDEEEASGSESEEEEEVQDVYICNLCSKEFKSVEQIEQHFQSKAHKKAEAEAIRKRRERERKAANRELGKQQRLEKALAAQGRGGGGGSVSVSVAGLSLLPPAPPSAQEEEARGAKGSRREGEQQGEEQDSQSEEEGSDEASEEEDEGFMLVQLAAQKAQKCRLGLPDMDSDSD